MNAELIMQIVEESKQIPKEQFSCEHWYIEENGVVTMCPIGYHISQHPEIREQLECVIISHTFPNGKTLTRWDINRYKLAHYLGLTDIETSFLFVSGWPDQIQFADAVTTYLNGLFEIRECQGDHCHSTYTTTPEDKACLCENCKDYMLEMCGL